MKNGKKLTATPIFESLMYQLLETELGGVKVYETALQCVLNDDLKQEWQGYLSETKRHVQIARALLEDLGLDPEAQVSAREPVRIIGTALVAAMQAARSNATPEEAELTAADCVVEAETKDHANWELVGALAEKADAATKKILKAAYDQVEKDEDHHLYHSAGWSRELWIQGLGMTAVLPPPEEVKEVETAIGAARAKQAREKMA